MPTRRHGNWVEGFGIVYAEAAWCGVPSLAGTYSGAVDFVDDNANGRLVDGEGPIASTLIDMLSDREALAAMGQLIGQGLVVRDVGKRFPSVHGRSDRGGKLQPIAGNGHTDLS